MTAQQLPLVEPVRPPDLPGLGIDFHNCYWQALPECEARLAILDPPWKYSQKIGNETPYPGLPTREVMAQVDDMALTRMAKNSRIALWFTWPLLPELWGWCPPGFRLVTGGSWSKSGECDSGHYGQGYHWAGCSEGVLVFVKGSPPNHRSRAGVEPGVKLRNSWVEGPGEHSRKPGAWEEQWIRRWTNSGDTVFVPYGGLLPEALPCVRTGRRLVAAEVDPVRYNEALALLAQGR